MKKRWILKKFFEHHWLLVIMLLGLVGGIMFITFQQA